MSGCLGLMKRGNAYQKKTQKILFLWIVYWEVWFCLRQLCAGLESSLYLFFSSYDYCCYFVTILILYNRNALYFWKLKSKQYLKCFFWFIPSVWHTTWFWQSPLGYPGWMSILRKRSTDHCGPSSMPGIREGGNHCYLSLQDTGGRRVCEGGLLVQVCSSHPEGGERDLPA